MLHQLIAVTICLCIAQCRANSNYQKYSRQILVHGAATQLALEQASISLIGTGDLVRETGKNLVLAGVGGVQLVEGFRDTSHHLKYLRSLATTTLVDSVPCLPSQADCVVCINLDSDSLGPIMRKCRTNGVKCVVCGTSQNGGYVYPSSVEDKYSKLAVKSSQELYKSITRDLSISASVVGAFAAQQVIAASTSDIPDSHPFIFNMSKMKLASLDDMRILVVGAGAIGCEILKNIANIVRRQHSSSGHITVADNDAIELSNLHRQLLFREKDIGDAKAIVAAARVKEMNPAINISALCRNIDETMRYDEQFWRSFDVVISAVDNIETRRFLNDQCVTFELPMIDAGTSGYMGHTQVIVPHVTEHYSSMDDTGEQDGSIPICTVKAFPQHPHHCIAWAKSLFDDIFARPQHTKPTETRNESDADIILRALKVSIALYNRLFHDDIARLIDMYPLNSTEEDGVPVWSDNRTMPRPKKFDGSDTMCRNFVLQTARILCGKNTSIESLTTWLHEAEKRIVTENIDVSQELSNFSSSTFDKDNWNHVQFIYSAANSRCDVYGLPAVSVIETHQVAGALIPALATSTAAVSGLAIIELLKLARLQEHAKSYSRPLRTYLRHASWRKRNSIGSLFRNSFLNVNTSELVQAEPAHADKISTRMRSWFWVTSRRFSDWDRIEYSDSVTIEHLTNSIKRRFDAEVTTVLLADGTIVYSSVLPEYCIKPSSRIVDIVGGHILHNQSFIDLQIDAENSEGSRVLVPTIRVGV